MVGLAIIRAELRNAWMPREGKPYSANDFLPARLHKGPKEEPRTVDDTMVLMKAMSLEDNLEKYSSQEWIDVWGDGAMKAIKRSRESVVGKKRPVN